MNEEERRDTYNYLVCWDMYGLEALVNMTRAEQEHMVAVLAADDPTAKMHHSNPLHYMLLRARFNEQRNYEVYAFISELEDDEIENLFKTSPQVIVDAIRSVGKCLYGQKSRRNQVIT